MNNSDRLDPIDHKRCEALEDLLEASKSLHYAVRVLDKTAAYIKTAPHPPGAPAAGPATAKEILEAVSMICDRHMDAVPTAFAFAPKVYRAGISEVKAFVEKCLRELVPAPRLPAQGPSERDCTCLGTCKGAEGLAPGWRCALTKTRNAPAPQGSASPAPDDEMVGFPYRTPEDEEISYSQEAAEQALEAAAEPPGAEAGPGDLPEVGGRRLSTSNADFERKCLVQIGLLQENHFADTALISLLCEAVRCVREYNDVHADQVKAQGNLLDMLAREREKTQPPAAADEREAFEAWAKINLPYSESYPHNEWLAWKERAARSTPPSGGRT